MACAVSHAKRECRLHPSVIDQGNPIGMRCLRCTSENTPAQKFCGECGARLTATCASCGATNPPEQKFCGECGSKLAPGATPQKVETPKHLAQRILDSRSAL
jgi:uncharacterized OB-fold protein